MALSSGLLSQMDPISIVMNRMREKLKQTIVARHEKKETFLKNSEQKKLQYINTANNETTLPAPCFRDDQYFSCIDNFMKLHSKSHFITKFIVLTTYVCAWVHFVIR